MTDPDLSEDLRVLSPTQLIAWAEGSVRAARLRTFRDVIPGGFMAALAPIRVDWEASDPFGNDPWVVVRNVSYGGNPLEKTTVLHQVHVPLHGVAFVEFNLVPSTRGGLHAPAHHAQLRFVFQPDKRPVLLSLADATTGSAAHIPDLILSWESWHETTVRYSGIRGLDAAAYKLSLRAYAGPQRFLEDTLHGRAWFSYRLRMPGGITGASELLKVVLALGDGVARHTIAGQLQRGDQDWLKHAPPEGLGVASASEWQRLRELVESVPEYQDPRLNLSSDEESYQTLVRSCATLARYTILTATHRLIDRGHSEGLDKDHVPPPILAEPVEWMKDIAHAGLRGLFARAPLALAYIMRHPQSVPDKIPEELAAAGLVEQRDGKPWLMKYTHQGTKPYDRSGRYGVDYA
jgi:hypothetical protein